MILKEWPLLCLSTNWFTYSLGAVMEIKVPSTTPQTRHTSKLIEFSSQVWAIFWPSDYFFKKFSFTAAITFFMIWHMVASEGSWASRITWYTQFIVVYRSTERSCSRAFNDLLRWVQGSKWYFYPLQEIFICYRLKSKTLFPIMNHCKVTSVVEYPWSVLNFKAVNIKHRIKAIHFHSRARPSKRCKNLTVIWNCVTVKFGW